MIEEAVPFVQNYLTKKHLASLGYQFDPSELSDFECEAYKVISNQFDKLREEKAKREG